MKVLLNRYNLNHNTNFKAGKIPSMMLPAPNAMLRGDYNIDLFYDKSALYLKDKIDKKEFLQEFFNLYKNYDKGCIKLNKKEGEFLANISMSLDMFDTESLPDNFLKKSIKNLILCKDK